MLTASLVELIDQTLACAPPELGSSLPRWLKLCKISSWCLAEIHLFLTSMQWTLSCYLEQFRINIYLSSMWQILKSPPRPLLNCSLEIITSLIHSSQTLTLAGSYAGDTVHDPQKHLVTGHCFIVRVSFLWTHPPPKIRVYTSINRAMWHLAHVLVTANWNLCVVFT